MNTVPVERERRNDWVVRQYRSGRTLTDIARDVGLTKMRVQQIVRAAGVSRREGGKWRAQRVFGTRPSVARGVTLTPLADRLVRAAAERAGVGVSHVVDYAVRMYAGELTEREFGD
jgi:hypothetical protein